MAGLVSYRRPGPDTEVFCQCTQKVYTARLGDRGEADSERAKAVRWAKAHAAKTGHNVTVTYEIQTSYYPEEPTDGRG
jgi:hypothetical protein